MRQFLAVSLMLLAAAFDVRGQGVVAPDLPLLPQIELPPLIEKPPPPKQVEIPPIINLPPLPPPGNLPPLPKAVEPAPIIVPGVPPEKPAPPPRPNLPEPIRQAPAIIEPAPPVPPSRYEDYEGAVFMPAAISGLAADDTFRVYRTWGGADFTLWRFSRMPVAVPLAVTTTSSPGPGVNILGVDPNARVILGGDQISNDPTNGGRLWFGFWFDSHRSLGFEVAGMWVETPNQNVGVQSNATGTPMYSRPVFIPAMGPSVYDISYPTYVRGNFVVETQQVMQGLEANFIGFALGDQRFALEVLAGGRFLNLEERLNLNYQMTNLVAMPAFGNEILAAGTTAHVNDTYRTTNQFYGGQIGGRLETNLGRLSLGLAGKIAFGVNNMTLHVDGNTTRSDVATAYPAGILANAANIGRYQDSRYAYVPEGNLSIGWWFTPNLRLKVGYNLLYISDVIRPGNHITNVVNPAGVPVDQMYGSAPVLRSPPLFQRSDFLAEGFTFGIDFRY